MAVCLLFQNSEEYPTVLAGGQQKNTAKTKKRDALRGELVSLHKAVCAGLFGRFCFGKARYARDLFQRSAFAQQVYALKTLENAAFF